MPIPDAGRLLDYDAFMLASLAAGDGLLPASVGFATINALLDIEESLCSEVNAVDVIAERGSGVKVAVVGHFPFVSKLKEIADELWVLELHPREGAWRLLPLRMRFLRQMWWHLRGQHFSTGRSMA